MAKALNGRACCILEICCLVAALRHAAIVEELLASDTIPTRHASGDALEDAERRKLAEGFADWLENFDLAPRGTLGPFKNEIARLAVEHNRKHRGDHQ